MLYYLNAVRSLVKDNQDYPKVLGWFENPPVIKIQDCINSYDAFKTLRSFCKEVGLDKDKVLALTELLLSLIPLVKVPKAIADYSVDYNGVYDFQFTIDDRIKILANKKPTSRPKNDKKGKQYKPEYKEVSASYIFGLEYNPKTKLMRLRYKLYPQKHWWGFRYEERLRPFEDFLAFAVKDLIYYLNEDLSELKVLDDDSPQDEEEPVTFEDEM